MQYFYDCKDATEAKTKFRKLAKEHHPDVGGDEAIMKEIQKQYDAFDTNTSDTHRYGNINEDLKRGFEQFRQNHGFAFRGFGTYNTNYRPFDEYKIYNHDQAEEIADLNL